MYKSANNPLDYSKATDDDSATKADQTTILLTIVNGLKPIFAALNFLLDESNEVRRYVRWKTRADVAGGRSCNQE